jgi:hypothetical protein
LTSFRPSYLEQFHPDDGKEVEYDEEDASVSEQGGQDVDERVEDRPEPGARFTNLLRMILNSDS